MVRTLHAPQNAPGPAANAGRARLARGRGGLWLPLAAWLLAAAGLPALAAAPGPLNLPSPEWRDQVIYFLMTDRFDDGDSTNNDQHAGEYAAADPARYNGGDLRGVTRRLDYIQGLGATTVWITPPVSNLWWDQRAQHGGYHGYWAEDFSKVDAHLGNLADYQNLSRALHGRGMYLVQDIVLNHTGNWFDYEGGFDPKDPVAHLKILADTRGRMAPSQKPFDQNNPADARQRAAGIYHWTPAIGDYRDDGQRVNYQMAGLDDINSENPIVRRVLRKSYGDWIRKVGVDGFRVDTILYVPPESVADFLYSNDPKAPGIARVAAQTGRKQFHVFGEGFAIDKPFDDTQAKRIAAWSRQADGQPLMPGMINFPLYGSLGDVFARGRPTAELAWRIEDMMRVNEHPELMPSFVDNHDVDRFLAGGDEVGLQQALLAILTLPGIPTIYYGTEQGFRVPRAAMFAAGSDSGGRDHFDTRAPMYQFLQRAIALRRGHKVFSRGTPKLLRSNAAGPGLLAWRMDAGADTAVVVFNTGAGEALLDHLDTGLAPGRKLLGAFDLQGTAPDEVVGEGGLLSLRMPARSARVWLVGEQGQAPAAAQARIDISASPAAEPLRVVEDFEVSGSAEGAHQLQLVVDGDLAQAKPVVVDARGHWHAQVDTSAMVDAKIDHRVVAFDPASGAVSAARRFTVARPWTVLADVADAVADDHGRDGKYRYPTDSSWATPLLDIRKVRVEGAGGAMRLSVQMGSFSRVWNPPNGFDHVAYSIYIDWPDAAPGVRVMPFQNAQLPGDMAWKLHLRSNGWSNALFSSEGAAADNDGRALTPAADIDTDPDTNTVRFTLAPTVLGQRKSLAGTRIHISVWDYDGGYRGLGPEPGASTFGGGDGRRDPLVMDEAVIVLPPGVP